MGAKTPVTFTVHDDVPQGAGTAVDAGLGEANAAAAPLHEVRPLACVARLASGEIVGGVVGRTWGLCCEVQQIWVHPAHRRRGIGARLIRDLHRRAEARGCRTFYLETMSFQAPRLYRSLGYVTRLEIGGFGDGISKHFMVRDVPCGRATRAGVTGGRVPPPPRAGRSSGSS